MFKLLDCILALNAEADWRPEDVERVDGGQLVFERFAEALLGIFHDEFPGISRACISLAGLECGFLQPVATWPADAKSRTRKIPRQDADTLHNENNKQELVTTVPANLHPFVPSPDFSNQRHLAVKLVGYGEYYGLIWLYARSAETFSTESQNRIKDILPALSRTVAEANFSMRLQRLAAPLESPNGRAPTREQIYNLIANQAALGLAADGAVLRIHEPNSRQLAICGVGGHPGVDHEEDSPIRERICKLVFDSEQGYAVHNVRSNVSFGVTIKGEDKAALGEGGVASFMILRLQSDVVSSEETSHLGTLAVVHHRPHDFSLRDIRLARMFAERVGDDLALLNQKDKLEQLILTLKMQYNMVTRAELIALMAHDLGHKAIEITQRIGGFTAHCKKVIRDRRSPDAIDGPANELKGACQVIENEIGQIQRINRTDEKPVWFDIRELFEQTGSTMRQVLERNNMELDIQITGKMRLYGPRSVFDQVIFNLVINSVDAQRSVAKQRKNTIHIHSHEESQGGRTRIIIQFYDDGPGISYPHFPEFKDVLKLGTTSKPEGQGTGTGLPVSRSLLDKYFKGDLDIKERRPARFEIIVPVDAPEKKAD